MWDVINAYRVGVYKLPLLFGSHDSHNYTNLPSASNTGRGWVMVKASPPRPTHCGDGAR